MYVYGTVCVCECVCLSRVDLQAAAHARSRDLGVHFSTEQWDEKSGPALEK